VSVAVEPEPAGSDVLAISVTNSASALVALAGIPNFTYTVQRATAFNPLSWENLAVVTADGFGQFTILDPMGGSTNRLYRTVRGIAP
jgi:hypothetical protein